MGIPLAVLIVEDSESDAQLIVRLLKKVGYEVVSEQVETAAQMRAALEKQVWDVVISDYSLPQFNGHAALRLLQEMGLDIPFIVVSGTIGEEIAVDMMKSGAHDYLMKGNLARLAPAIERELAQSEVRRKRKQAEEALRDSEEHYRTLIEQASDGIFIADSRGHHVDVNITGHTMLGYSREEILAMHLSDLIPNEDLAAAPPRLDDMRAGKTIVAERRLKRKDGTLLPVEVSAKILPNGYIQSFVRDITERKQVEDTLRESEERFRLLVENAEEVFYQVSTQDDPMHGQVLFVSPQAKNFTGCEPEIFANNPELWAQLIHPDDLPQVTELTRRLLSEGVAGSREYRIFHRLDEEYRWVGEHITLRFDSHGKLIGYQGVARDITERKLAELKFSGLLESAPDAMVVVDQQGRIAMINKQTESLFGYTRQELVGQSVEVIIPERFVCTQRLSGKVSLE